MTISEFFKDWFIPISSIVLSVISVGLAIWFASSAKKDADDAKATLSKVNNAIDGWQTQIMSSTIGILDSTPQVIEAKAALTKLEAAKTLTQGIQETIHKIANNPQPGAAGHTQEQNLKVLTQELHRLLTSMVESKGGKQ